MYTVTPIPAKNRIDVVFSGDFGHDDAEFREELRAAVEKTRSGEGHFDMLVDFSQAPVMSPEMAKNGEEASAWCVQNGMRKSANLMSSQALLELQEKRVTARDEKFQYFETRADAESWLAE